MATFETDGSQVRPERAPLGALGLEPPTPPNRLTLLKRVLSKHFFLGWKRKRPMSSLLPVLLWSILVGVLYNTFESIGDRSPAAIQAKMLLEVIILPLYLTMLVSQSMSVAVADLVSEKEDKMKIIQDVYGLPASVYWFSWYIYYSLVAAGCIFIVMVILLFIQPVFSGMNVLILIIVWYMSFMQQFIVVCVLSALFDTVRTATMFSSFLNLLLMGLAAAMQGLLTGKSRSIWYLAGLLPQTNTFNAWSSIFWHKADYLCTGSDAATQHCTRPGLTFGNLFADHVCVGAYFEETPGAGCSYPYKYDIFPAGSSLLMMLLNVVLYAVLAWWLENVRQGKYGSARPWCFCLDPRWLFSSSARGPRLLDAELGGQGSQVAMSIRELTKVFKMQTAVDHLTLDVLGSEIFALLGHNGAGKTTAINCIVGLIPPTSGGAIVNGYDIATNLELARQQLSICPQDDPLYKEFTVRRHLVFFASLRGVSEARVEERVMGVLTALGIPEKVDAPCQTLSGGQKRRLWVATALLGDSPISFLDEPTSGMDPSSRRELWGILLDMKAHGRCVIFTTHYLEEADVLADRKAVLARGKVMAVGTSRELKMHFGLGYHLSLELTRGASDATLTKIRNLIGTHIAGAMEEEIAAEEHAQAADAPLLAKFMLPYAEVKNFGPLLSALDEGKASLGVDNYNIAMTSLEEVFMALGQQAEAAAGTRANTDFTEVETESAVENHREESSFARTVMALIRIRLLAIFTDRRALYVTVILPIVFVILSVALSSVQGRGSASPGNDWSIAFYPPMAFGLTTLTFTLTIVTERDERMKIKHVVMAQGASPLAYWTGTAVAHYVASIPVLVAFIVMLFVKGSDVIIGTPLLMVLVMCVVYPAELLLYAYCLAMVFKQTETAAKYASMLSLFAGTLPIGAEFICLVASQEFWGQFLHITFSILDPVYALPGMIVNLVFKGQGVLTFMEVWTSSAAIPLYLCPVCCLLWAGVLIYKETRSYTSNPGEFVHFDGSRKDADVVQEEERILSTTLDPRTEVARYEGLTHTYRSKNGPVTAVRGISLGVRHGECFGLLGPNGAGKTTTLAVLTGEVRPPTAGTVNICGHNVADAQGLWESYQVLGVCPQVNPLWESISGAEHLLLYGRVKGVPEARLQHTVDTLLRRLGLLADAKKKAGQYSGGMKRKLSLAIALIGHSPLLFLDEPSAAVDAGAKRHLWKVIKRRGPDQTVVLTTHSMEEAEALCDRLAIQVQGQLRCLGSSSHIKRKYGSGYQLELFCDEASEATSAASLSAPEPSQAILDFVRDAISPQSELLEFHRGRYLFQLPPQNSNDGDSTKLGTVFTKLQESKARLGINDYSVTQPSLEQVFLRFAREQVTEGEDRE